MLIFEKIDIRPVFSGHFDTLVSDITKKTSKWDLLLFYGVPLLLAGGLVYFRLVLTSEVVSILVTALAIFSALLFNMLVLMFNLARDSDEQNKLKFPKDQKALIRQVYANIAYSIVVSLTAVILLLVYTYIDGELVERIMSGLIYFLILNFVLTIVMALNRVYYLLDEHF